MHEACRLLTVDQLMVVSDFTPTERPNNLPGAGSGSSGVGWGAASSVAPRPTTSAASAHNTPKAKQRRRRPRAATVVCVRGQSSASCSCCCCGRSGRCHRGCCSEKCRWFSTSSRSLCWMGCLSLPTGKCEQGCQDYGCWLARPAAGHVPHNSRRMNPSAAA